MDEPTNTSSAIEAALAALKRATNTNLRETEPGHLMQVITNRLFDAIDHTERALKAVERAAAIGQHVRFDPGEGDMPYPGDEPS